MKILFGLLLFIISGTLGFAQFSGHRIYHKVDEISRGIYMYSKQRGGESRLITYSEVVAWRGAYHLGYEQYENIMFFRGASGENIIYDRINHNGIYTNMNDIDSIVFSDYNAITIKGSHAVRGNNPYGTVELEWVNTINEEITLTYSNLNNNIYFNVNVTEEMIGQEILRNELEGKRESFFLPIASEDNKYFLFNFYGRNIVYDLSRFDYDYIDIYAIHNTTFDEYYIFIDYYKFDHH